MEKMVSILCTCRLVLAKSGLSYKINIDESLNINKIIKLLQYKHVLNKPLSCIEKVLSIVLKIAITS